MWRFRYHTFTYVSFFSGGSKFECNIINKGSGYHMFFPFLHSQ